ncbi:acid protease [Phanerochaete sordida]|uniref:Acid protease n=1 Tax=Phanerochaete sordida TaxID=48140 RepID=A0A9P3GHD0_9APHY|nr:acid protease [Phanerochaete sordida]
MTIQRTSAIGLTDTADALYLVNITLGGQEFTVQLDTGSSDLWVYAPDQDIKISNDSQLTANITYGTGSVSGPIQFAELKVGEYTVPSQAFINVKTVGAGTPAGLVGIMGVSFDSDTGSRVAGTVHKAWGEANTLGRTTISNILAQNASLQPSYDIALSRLLDLDGGSGTGAFIVGAHDPAFAQVAQAPPVPRVVDSEWAGYLDGMKVNGQSVPFPKSVVKNATEGKLVALFDSGTSFVIIPGALSDAVYGTIDGSIKVNKTWYVPCYSGANVTFTIGGQDFPVHPLDVSSLATQTMALKDGTNTTFISCVGTFQDLSIVFGDAGIGDVDLILGDAFLRNAYTSFTLGAANREGDEKGSGGSFLQLLATTDADAAWPDFQLTRAAALALAFPAVIDPMFLPALFPAFAAVENATSTGVITPFAAPAPAGGASPAGALADDAGAAAGGGGGGSASAWIDKYGPVVVGLLVANLAVVVLLCIAALVACTRGAMRSGARTRTISPSYAPVGFREKAAAGYDPEESAPIRGYGDQ